MGNRVTGRTRFVLLTVLAALLVFIPTVFGIFPELGTMPAWIRLIVTGAWVVIATFAVISAMRRDQQLDRLMRKEQGQRDRLHQLALSATLSALLRAGGIPGNYEANIYVFDANRNLLMPAFPRATSDPSDLTVFAPGNGATGLAWERGELILVTGDAVSDSSYGLTAQQQAHFSAYNAVAATPILAPEGDSIGVLTAIAMENDLYFESESGEDDFRSLADVIGVLLARVSVPST
ncbi:hypothetical protein BH23ACT12_BH23ACT12_21540 [soil metagenome]